MVSTLNSTNQDARPLSRAELVAIAQEWSTRINASMTADHPSDRRWYSHLHAEEAYDVMLLGWNFDQSTDFHNHGGSSGAVHVVRGALVEERLGEDAKVTSRTVNAGRATAFGPEAIHNVYNAGGGVSLSIHVYSPPLTTMTYFDAVNGEVVQRETVDASGPEPDAYKVIPIS
jgi:predicted metal-dependent enzyme (double-stranded beta helix superfamily)